MRTEKITYWGASEFVFFV